MATFPFGGNLTWRQADTYRDAKGNTSTFRYYLFANTAANVDAVETAAENIRVAYTALTNAAYQGSIGVRPAYGPTQYGSSATAYESVIQKAVLVFQDAAGQLHRFTVMAPKLSIFKTDKVTVDPANAAVVTFVGLFSANVAPGAGTPYVVSRQNILIANYMGGVFRSSRIRRRVNVLTLQADLTGGLPAE